MSYIKSLITRVQCRRYGIPYEKGMWIHPSFRVIKAGDIKLGGVLRYTT